MFKSLELRTKMKYHANRLNFLEDEYGREKLLQILEQSVNRLGGDVQRPRDGAYHFILYFPNARSARVLIRNDQGIKGTYIVDVQADREGFRNDVDFDVMRVNAKRAANRVMEEVYVAIETEPFKSQDSIQKRRSVIHG